MFGDYNTDNYEEYSWVLFVIASFFMPLVLLNLLIALMSDTYSRVMADLLP